MRLSYGKGADRYFGMVDWKPLLTGVCLLLLESIAIHYDRSDLAAITRQRTPDSLGGSATK